MHAEMDTAQLGNGSQNCKTLVIYRLTRGDKGCALDNNNTRARVHLPHLYRGVVEFL